jgi:hypothetical protein
MVISLSHNLRRFTLVAGTVRLEPVVTAEISDRSVAIVTPCYLRDLSRCELLAESVDRFVPGMPHYLIVRHSELRSFRHLEGGKRRIIESRELLGDALSRKHSGWFRREPAKTTGWIVQQILKIAAIDAIPERTLVFTDSDVVLFRTFSCTDLLVDGKVGLLDTDFNNAETRLWASEARRLLGLKQRNGDYRNHVGQMICWNREIVKQMRHRMEVQSGRDWREILAQMSTFSEYMIYGTFVREVLGYDAVDHAPSTIRLVKGMWRSGRISLQEINMFFADFDPRTVALMIHSKADIEPADYRQFVERLWMAQHDKN